MMVDKVEMAVGAVKRRAEKLGACVHFPAPWVAANEILNGAFIDEIEAPACERGALCQR